MITSAGLLFIEPERPASRAPIIDAVTRRMTAAYRQALPIAPGYNGYHVCVCGAESGTCDLFIPHIGRTNTLCIHYLAFHRDEVREEQITRLHWWDYGEAEPTREELHWPTR